MAPMGDSSELFGEVEERGRFKSLVQPTRRVLGRVLRPYFAHQVALVDKVQQRVDDLDRGQHVLEEVRAAVEQLAATQAQLAQALETVTARLGELGERQGEIDRKASAVAAVTWDHVALTRRLAAIEDALVTARPETAAEAGSAPA